ncbi:MRN complex-interacting protein isoform X2 [Oryza brachyantha]|uniref:MRN complex-interacting protein isoform X2 n=1 Tax=Oryza brachyantha TaxID=4533 RepID=UPI0007761434|nr:MRN complex-interacting protein isoform X2 [Oryza brachyantha]
MATTLFLALQCVQCSTMQVKPQKKSSNKWVCVVCNQRQSVMRVHARGCRAADLRRFVQDANLSRGRAAHVPLPVPGEDWTPAVSGEQQDDFPRGRKRRMDWSEYLDDPGECDGGGGGDEGTEDGVRIQVTTELPEKRPKVTSLKRAPKAQLGLAVKRPKTPPVDAYLPKRQLIEESSPPCSAATTVEAQRSKWSNYLDTSFFEERSGFQDSGQHCAELECFTTDVVVNDEVHPDFM